MGKLTLKMLVQREKVVAEAECWTILSLLEQAFSVVKKSNYEFTNNPKQYSSTKNESNWSSRTAFLITRPDWRVGDYYYQVPHLKLRLAILAILELLRKIPILAGTSCSGCGTLLKCKSGSPLSQSWLSSRLATRDYTAAVDLFL
ncbi:hypothetical protein RF11_05515 [Thelohanellus kitauei]|uniref:Uncharacterized protein n=1 Tax=Thelohanellus kitauei TaxID=669202 RepID=A0A0C2MK09_THEKT|nr:hypothetical protein RF11_05515 [Thelohanellus kitauei]